MELIIEKLTKGNTPSQDQKIIFNNLNHNVLIFSKIQYFVKNKVRNLRIYLIKIRVHL